MVGQVVRRCKARRREKAALQVVQQGQGYAVRTWRLPDGPAWPTVAPEIRAWLAQQITGTATPYGFSRYYVLIGLVAIDESQTQRTPLWKILLEPFARAETTLGLDIAYEQLRSLPVAYHPSATHVEVYLIS